VTDASDSIGACLAGRISPQVALSRLLLGGATPDAIEADLRRRPPGPARDALAGLVTANRAALERLAAQVAGGGNDHAALWDPSAGPGSIAAFFDRAVAHSPEASVALYSLGDPAILAAATREIVDCTANGCSATTCWTSAAASGAWPRRSPGAAAACWGWTFRPAWSPRRAGGMAGTPTYGSR